ncbi:MAG: tyrosine-type recombinase/integrase [Actinomycetota bacterium]
MVRGKLLSNAFLFELSLKAACSAAGLVDSQGRATISAHRFRHTIGTQLAEGGARLQTIMAVLGHYAGDPVQGVLRIPRIALPASGHEASSSSRWSRPSKIFWRPTWPLATASSR